MTSTPTRRAAIATTAAALALPAAFAFAARAAEREVIDVKVDLALTELYQTVSGARELASRAVGVLIMPDVTKGGFIVGGAYGEGALMIDETPIEYYSVAAASFGFQAGLQSTKQALFFLTEDALARFRASDGFELGADAEVTVPGDGIAANIDSTTSRSPIIAIVFGQDGLLAGASLEGAKYTRIER